MKTLFAAFAVLAIIEGNAGRVNAEPIASGKVCNLNVETADAATDQIAQIFAGVKKNGCAEGDILKVYGLRADPFFVAGTFAISGIKSFKASMACSAPFWLLRGKTVCHSRISSELTPMLDQSRFAGRSLQTPPD